MRIAVRLALVAMTGCAAEGGPNITLPQVYPPVRAATPTSLIANPQYAAPLSARVAASSEGAALGQARQALGEAINLATAIQERFYNSGPTAILRIVKQLDDRVSQLDTSPSKHGCLTSEPVASTYNLPAGQSLAVKLQCLQSFGTPGTAGGWVAFGFDSASAADAGPAAASEGNDFYLVEGQDGGMGGAYHVHGGTGNIEAWMAVADSNAPMNSQVIMHLVTDAQAGTLELALAGSGVGFCSAHLKTNPGFLFIEGKTNGAPAPGTNIAAGTQYCDAARSGCFDASALQTDLGSAAASCASIARSSFDIHVELDASGGPGSNVTPSQIYDYFNQAPAGIPAF
jgi:hypothetical protein